MDIGANGVKEHMFNCHKSKNLFIEYRVLTKKLTDRLAFIIRVDLDLDFALLLI